MSWQIIKNSLLLLHQFLLPQIHDGIAQSVSLRYITSFNCKNNNRVCMCCYNYIIQ